MEDDIYQQGFRNTIFNYIGRMGSLFFASLAYIVIWNGLQRSDYGIFSLLFSILATVSLLSASGIPSVIQRYLPEYFRKAQYLVVKRLISYSALIQLLIGGILVGLLLILKAPISKMLKAPQLLYYLPLFSLIIIAVIQIKLLRAILSALLMQRQENIFLLLFSFLQASLYYGTLRLGYGLRGLIFSALISNLFLLLVYSLTIFRKVSLFPHRGNAVSVFKRISRYGLISYFNELSYGIFEIHIDLFIIASFLANQEAVALYAFAAKASGFLIDAIPGKMGDTVIAPIFISRYARNKDDQELCYLFRLLNKFIAFFLFPLIIALLFLGDKILALVAPKYLEVLNIFLMFAIFHGVNAIAFSTGTIWQVLEKPQVGLYSRIFVIYNLIMDIILVKIWGIMGVALATGTALTFKAIFQFLMTRRYIKINFPWRSFFKTGINSLLMGILIVLLRTLVTNLISLVMVILAGAIFYLVISALLRVFEDKEREIINRMIGKRVFVF